MAAELSPEIAVLVVEPEVVFAAELSPEIAVLVVEPEVAVLAVEPEVAVLVAESEVVPVAGLSPEVAVLAAEPEAAVLVVEPEVVSEAVGLQASVDIVVAFAVLIPVSVVVVEVDSSGHPKFPAFPNVDYFASSSSSVEVVG